MTTMEKIALAGVAATFFAIYKNNAPTVVVTTNPPQKRKGWAGAGTDPFGTSYTVTGRAARGGL